MKLKSKMSAAVGYGFGTREGSWVGSPHPMCAYNRWHGKAPLVGTRYLRSITFAGQFVGNPEVTRRKPASKVNLLARLA